MKSSPKYLLIPDKGREEIHALLVLSAEQLTAVIQTLRSTETLKTQEASYRRVAANADLTNEQALAVLSAMTNLVRQRKRYTLTDEQLLQELSSLYPEEVEHLHPSTKAALLELLSESDEGYLVEKAESLQAGFRPHLVSVQSICDVRPVFDKDRKQIAGVLLITSLGITTHDENHKDQTFVLQMTHADLQKFRDCLAEADRKLSTMREEFGRQFEILSS